MKFTLISFYSWCTILLLTSNAVFSQSSITQDWVNKDFINDGLKGVSSDKAYELVKNKKPTTIIVAVLDSGVDIYHEDLQGKIWINKDEIPDNDIDDDRNGYIDDVNGWNFLGNKNGENINYDTYELTRIYAGLDRRFKNISVDEINKDDKDEYRKYLEIKEDYENKLEEVSAEFGEFAQLASVYKFAQDYFADKLGKTDYSIQELIAYPAEDEDIENLKEFFINANQNDLLSYLDEGKTYFEARLEYHLNPEFDPRHIVGDDINNLLETGYGNNMVAAADPEHGTHVAGIIAANRENEIGIRGIANTVLIMPVRVVPDGDERDKDVANGIRYAADNGARIINMSFGKGYSAHPEIVRKAIQYATDKGVLFVHAAGNDSSNNDKNKVYPNGIRKGNKNAENWIEVGASASGNGAESIGDFSNFGKKSVDVFAPGVDILSTVPSNEYEVNSGTSMAAPVVSGVAALIWSYYPDLSPKEIKDLLTDTVLHRSLKTKFPGRSGNVKFKKLSDSGGIINAYNAILKAENF